MTQGTEAMGEVTRALSQIYYCIDGHDIGKNEERPKDEREGGWGERKSSGVA